MMAPFPWWVDALLALVVAWPLTLAVVLVLAFTGKFTSGRWRVLAWGLGGGLGLILLVAGGAFLIQPVNDEWTKLRLKTISGVTHEPRTMNGFVLPAGSKVRWSDVGKGDFFSADVPVNMAMLGVVVKGEIDHDARAQEEYYDLSLVEPKQFDAWACGPREARIKEDASMLACTLAVETEWKGLMLPAGTYMDRTFPTVEMRFVMPDARGMALAGGALAVPAGGVLLARSNGTPVKVGAAWKDKNDAQSQATVPFAERGVKLLETADLYPTQDSDYNIDTKPRLQPEGLRGKLSEATRCKNETLTAGTAVDVPVKGELQVYDASGGSARVVPGCLR